ncbi:helix-hairpin-helix domain-containing protein [Chryseomicrobium palamuruense]|uniref:Helix-hairpin-helix domain-containing protein n=1 Tax=Chryseomicrobium palamuruense TaxID=682973 RepID=A0ABV8UZB7_9BACL
MMTSSPPPLEIAANPTPIETVDVPVEVPTTVIVEIKGAVIKPGIYELPSGSRLFELIEKAGGLLPESDDLQINQASLLTDEQSVYIPVEGETVPANSTESEFININTADANLLQTLPGIGPAKAAAIIAFREKTPFTTPEDLNEVDGIGDKTMEQLLTLISVK